MLAAQAFTSLDSLPGGRHRVRARRGRYRGSDQRSLRHSRKRRPQRRSALQRCGRRQPWRGHVGERDHPRAVGNVIHARASADVPARLPDEAGQLEGGNGEVSRGSRPSGSGSWCRHHSATLSPTSVAWCSRLRCRPSSGLRSGLRHPRSCSARWTGGACFRAPSSPRCWVRCSARRRASTYLLVLTWSADRYGLIGVAFSLQSWLLAAAFVVVIGAVVGAVASQRLRQRVPKVPCAHPT